MKSTSINFEEVKNSFSHNEYKVLLTEIKPRLANFSKTPPDNFIILRHDVEFSIARALDIGIIEAKENVQSTFFFQVKSSAYNPFSTRNLEKIMQLKSLGHTIGLHFYMSHIAENDHDNLTKEFELQKSLFEAGFGLQCEVFSFHRPPRWVLEMRDDFFCGALNAYGDSFFEFADNPLAIKYIADSMHRWNYGHPMDALNYPKIQILVHPDEWTDFGERDSSAFFGKLIKEHHEEFIQNLDDETKHFSEHKESYK